MDPVAVGQVIGNYRVEAVLGQGGMGVVYRARHLKLQRPVALKFLGPQIASDPLVHARFLREAQAASALDHPNIATVYEIGEHEGSPYIGMAFYEGEDLRARMARGRMSLAEAEGVLVQILQGIGAAHRAGVVHRDLKPANLLLTPPCAKTRPRVRRWRKRLIYAASR